MYHRCIYCDAKKKLSKELLCWTCHNILKNWMTRHHSTLLTEGEACEVLSLPIPQYAEVDTEFKKIVREYREYMEGL